MRTPSRLIALVLTVLAGVLFSVSPAWAADSFTPAVVNLDLGPGETATVDKTLHLDALPGAADIVIAIDTTGSMCGAISQAQTEATQIVNDVQLQIPGARFAVVDFKDYPFSPFGDPGDWPYLLRSPLTSSAAAVQAAINAMSCGGGNDGPEAYNRVFYEAVNDPALVYDPNAVRFLVVLGDNIPHDTTQQATFTNCPNTSVNDPGPDGILGNADDIRTPAAISGLNGANDTLLMINYGGFYLSCYQDLASATGGSAVLGGGGATLSAQIIAGIQAAAAHIDVVDLVVGPPGCPLSISFAPAPPYGPFTAPVDIGFTESITAPTLVGTYSCSVTAIVDGTPRAVQHINVRVHPGEAARLTLTPKTATNPVGTEHCVTATVTDAFGNPIAGVTVSFTVSGANSATGTAPTDASGVATFCYTGVFPGTDTIVAEALAGLHPRDSASKRWETGTSTAGCKITGGGRLTALNGDKATFGGNAFGSGPSGQEEYQDHGAAADLNVHSLTVDAVICSADGTSASIFGTASINGAGTFAFRIDVTDLGEPGTSDRYRIRLSNGYDSGDMLLSSGNIKIH